MPSLDRELLLTHLLIIVVPHIIHGLWILTDHIVQVALGLRKLHLVHTQLCVVVEEGFPAEHRGEFLGDVFKDEAHVGAVHEGDEGGGGGGYIGGFGMGEFSNGGWVREGDMHVVADPLDETGLVRAFEGKALLLDLAI